MKNIPENCADKVCVFVAHVDHSRLFFHGNFHIPHYSQNKNLSFCDFMANIHKSCCKRLQMHAKKFNARKQKAEIKYLPEAIGQRNCHRVELQKMENNTKNKQNECVTHSYSHIES